MGGPDCRFLPITATAEELGELLRQFQENQATQTREYQKLLREKDAELSHYKSAVEASGVAVPPLPKAPESVAESAPAAEEDTDAKVAGALREQRLLARVAALEGQRDTLSATVMAHERNIAMLEREREALEVSCAGLPHCCSTS